METETISFRIKKKSLRGQAHFFFDAIWKNQIMTRVDAYIYLAKKLTVPVSLCHFTSLNRTQLIESIKICIDLLNNSYTLHDLPKYRYL